MLILLTVSGCDSRTGNKKEVPTPDPDPVIMPYPSPPDVNYLDEFDDGGGLEVQQGNDSMGREDPVPEPSTFILVGSGVILLSMLRKRKKY